MEALKDIEDVVYIQLWPAQLKSNDNISARQSSGLYANVITTYMANNLVCGDFFVKRVYGLFLLLIKGRARIIYEITHHWRFISICAANQRVFCAEIFGEIEKKGQGQMK